jgi:L-asparagine transporter-like permease
MIFLTHYCFRRYHQRNGERKLSFRMRLFPYTTLLGLVLMGAVMITTYFTEAFKMTLVFGVPFLLILSIVYGLFFRKTKRVEALHPLPKV